MAKGCMIGRELQYAIGLALTDAAAFQAARAADPRRVDGCLLVKLDDLTLWVYDIDGTAPAGPTVIEPTAGDGQWVSVGGSGGLGVGMVNLSAARYASAGALAAYTRTDNVILADANGALGPQDGITGAVGDIFLLVDGAADADNGPYRIDVIGAGGVEYQMTRVVGADASAEVTAGMLVYVSEGTTHGNEWAFLTTDDVIVLNTTGLVYAWVPSLVDLASVATGEGADTIGLYDGTTVITATTVGPALVENRTALDVAEARVLVNEGELDTHRPGVPMIDRLIMLGAPAKIVQGDYITIGADLYEFRDDTPPTGGTAGRVWVYNGADSAASRANVIQAINGVIDGALIAGPEVATETMLAVAGTLLGTIDVLSADAVGGAIAPSATATACTENLTTATDLWDQGTMYAGVAQGPTQMQMCSPITITADHILQGWLEVEFDFTPTSSIVLNITRPVQNESWTETANRVVLTLAGAGAPNNQVGDIVVVFAQG